VGFDVEILAQPSFDSYEGGKWKGKARVCLDFTFHFLAHKIAPYGLFALERFTFH
jgi:hypothetical protein